MTSLFSGFRSGFKPSVGVRPLGETQTRADSQSSSTPLPTQSSTPQPPSSSSRLKPQFGSGVNVLHARGGKVGSGGKGLGGQVGAGLGKGLRRHRKIVRDSIRGITKGDIRRLARRGGVKRLSGLIYDEVRQVVKDRVKLILNDCVPLLEHANRKTITVNDIIFVLRRLGKPIYGFGDIETRRHSAGG